VPGVKPVSVAECDVTNDGLRAEKAPYAIVVPYSTCELDGWSVVHVIVAEFPVMPLEATALIVGIVTGVENVKLADVEIPAASAERTAKS
jgi:hypothetical protein